MSRARYLVGIDLGTTNCAVAFVDTKGKERPTAEIRRFELPQLVGPGEMGDRAMLPSFLYLPGGPELPAGAAALPWDEGAERIAGEFARVQGARVPGRLVASAKSWLCHAGVDREAAILPWAAPPDARRLSPVDASAALLRHIRDAWNHRMAGGDPAARLEEQDVVLTVPASFDEAARELTVVAAKRAGLTRLTLIEEPQAAFYCWILTHQEGWQKQVRAGELILVCDIGGGTTDFSLITVVETPTGPGFRRVAVGDHLLLGGDNIDLALAHRVEEKLAGVKLDAEQWSALRFACRNAKEKLLGGPGSPERWPVTIPGRGSKLIGGGLQSELTAAEVREVAVEGFFPKVERGAEPSRGGKLGLQEFGLPFVADPSIPRHLAAFLRRHRAEAIEASGHLPEDRPARPDAILFNGGALTPELVRSRLVEIVTSWFPEEADGPFAPRVLVNESLDLAVADGAAYYGVVRRGGGIRIGGGTARSFYVGFDGGEAGARAPWLCVVPRDAQEGDAIAIEGRDFELLVDRPVSFPLASSSVRAADRPGDLVAADADTIRELPPLSAMMKVGRKAKSERVPVRLESNVTEVGTIELWCHARRDERRWRLQIQFRTNAGAGGKDELSVDRAVLEQSLVDAAVGLTRRAFASVGANDPDGPPRVIKRLEEALELPREQWPPSVLRALWDPLRDEMGGRLRSPQHESRWLNLAGYCLRPGVGYPLDPVRIKALWPVFHQGVKHQKDVQVWAEWWILWRRVAAGLNRAHHDELHRRIAPLIVPPKGGSGAVKRPGRPKPEAHEVAELWRCAASLERLDAGVKEPLGNALAEGLRRPEPPAYLLWSLGRIGARVPLYGPANTVVGAGLASRWAEELLGRTYRPGRESEDARFALGQIGRVSGDRVRDLDEELRGRIAGRLEELGADAAAVERVREYRELGPKQESEALGDVLPAGLRLIGAEG